MPFCHKKQVIYIFFAQKKGISNLVSNMLYVRIEFFVTTIIKRRNFFEYIRN